MRTLDIYALTRRRCTEWMDWWKQGWIVWLEGMMDGLLDGLLAGWMDELTYSQRTESNNVYWEKELMDGWMDGWMDELTDRVGGLIGEQMGV